MNELLRIVKQRKLNKVLYVGERQLPLSAHELRSIRRLLEVHNSIVTANNYYSVVWLDLLLHLYWQILICRKS